MSDYKGDYLEDSTIRISFTTNDGNGGAVAPSSAFEAADIKIFKDGSDTEKTATDGLTMTSPFNATTGLHQLIIDTSDDTNDAGFWVTGSDYSIVLDPDETVDGQTVVAEIASFSIENRANALQRQVNRNADFIESQRGFHTWQGNYFYVDPVNGNDTTGDGSRLLPYATIQAAHDDLVTDSNHDVIFLVAGAAAGVTTHTVAATTTISKRYTFIRGPGRDFIVTRTGAGDTFAITADGVEISGIQIGTGASGSGDGISIVGADFCHVHRCWILDTRGDGIHCERSNNCIVCHNHFNGTGVTGGGQGIHITGSGGAGNANDTVIHNNHFAATDGTAILIEGGTTNDTEIHHNTIHDSGAGGTGWGIDITASSEVAQVHNNIFGNNADGNIRDNGTDSVIQNNESWTRSVQETTITGLASQTVFNLSEGSADNDAYNGLEIVIEDSATSVQKARGLILDYAGGAKTVTLAIDPGIFTIANGDRVRIQASATAPGVWDRILTGATHNIASSAGRRIRELDELLGYEGGSVWLDTVNGTPGTMIGENGTVNNPSDNITDTIAIAVARGLVRIRVASGSTVILEDDLEGYELHNSNWALQLEGFSISGSCLDGATVTGTGTGAIRPKLANCQLGAITLPPSIINSCGIGDGNGTFAFGSAGDYAMKDNYSVVPGSGTVNFVATGLGSATGINNRGWFGGANYTVDSDITISHEVVAGGGTTFNASGGEIELRGRCREVTFSLSAGAASTIQAIVFTGEVTITGTATAGTTIQLDGVGLEPSDDSVNTSVTNRLLNLTAINSEVDTALNTAIPGSPTAGSVNQRIKAIDELTETGGDGDLAVIKTQVLLIGSGVVDATSPVSDTAVVTITQGDDYENTESRALDFSNTDASWGGGDISNATVTFTAVDKLLGTTITKAGSVVDSTGSQKVRVELSSTETTQFISVGRRYDYQIHVTLPATGTENIQTIVDSEVNVIETLF